MLAESWSYPSSVVGVPCHHVIGHRRGRHASRRIGLHALHVC
jgi:hypothetical protein